MEKNINSNEASSASQARRILSYMKEGHTITGLEALDLFGCMRLGARIFDLKREGHVILRERVKVGKKYVARYHVPDEG